MTLAESVNVGTSGLFGLLLLVVLILLIVWFVRRL